MYIYLSKKYLTIINTILEETETKESKEAYKYLNKKIKQERIRQVEREHEKYLKSIGK